MRTIRFPDGQLNMKLELSDSTMISQRINTYQDLFEVALAKETMDFNLNNPYSELFIPCLFGQRSDRRFEDDESFGLKVITDFINNMYFNKVKVFDPHSDVSLALIKNSVKVSSFDYVSQTVTSLGKENLVLVSPDAGAYKKVFKYAEDLSLPLVAANKFRALDGAITLNILGDVNGKNCLIVDDICDGGYTFYLLSKALKAQGANKVYLYISHGYFSKGFTTSLEPSDLQSSLSNSLNHIYCTNSVKDITDGASLAETTIIGQLLTQYKII